MDIFQNLLSPNSGVLLALVTLLTNVFIQSQGALGDLLGIESRTWRVLRLFPFIALIDAFACPVVLLDSWLAHRYDEVNTEDNTTAPTSNAADMPKDIENEAISAWTSAGPVAKIFLAGLAGFQLFNLTTYSTFPFSIFCGWALFASFVTNMVLSRFADAEDEPVLPTQSTEGRHKRLVATANTLWWITFGIAIALIVQYMHLGWMGQYLVPRRLWMDWGPAQLAWTDNSTLTFPVPPHMPPPTAEQRELGKELVIGFYPSHSIAGAIFYTLNYLVFTVVMSICGTFFYGVPFILVCFVWWCAIAVSGYYVGDFIYRAIKETRAFALACRVTEIPGLIRSHLPWLVAEAIIWPPFVVGMVVTIFAGCFIFMLPVIAMSRNGLPLGYLLESPTMINDYLIVLDYPFGSYAAMAGSLIGISILGFRHWGIPLIVGKPRSGLSRSDRRYWSAVWTTSIMGVLTIFYYLFYVVDETNGFGISRTASSTGSGLGTGSDLDGLS